MNHDNILNSTELDTLTSMRNQALSHNIGYWKIYDWLANNLQSKGVATTDQTVLWLRGASEANAGRGAFSTLIRTYTESQYRLRYGSALPRNPAAMQEPSDAVANRLLRDMLGESGDWPKGQVPDIARIAFGDARAVGRVLFKTDLSDTAAELQRNSAWSGALLFTLLRNDQTASLLSTGAEGVLDTLNDLRDVLYAFSSYARGVGEVRDNFLANVFTAAGGDITAFKQVGVDTQISGPTLSAYYKSTGNLADLVAVVRRGAGSGAVGTAFKSIAEVG